MIMIGMTALPPTRVIKTAIIKMESLVINKEGIKKFNNNVTNCRRKTKNSRSSTNITRYTFGNI
jgi:hypothetical protein